MCPLLIVIAKNVHQLYQNIKNFSMWTHKVCNVSDTSSDAKLKMKEEKK